MKGKKEEEKHERRIKYTRSAVHTISSLHSVRAQNSNAGSGCMVSLDLDRCYMYKDVRCFLYESYYTYQHLLVFWS